MSVRAKFVVEEVRHHKQTPSGGFVTLQSVTADEIPENQRYHKYTPCGKIEMQIDNPPAFEQFHPGDEFYVDFNLVAPVAAETPAAG